MARAGRERCVHNLLIAIGKLSPEDEDPAITLTLFHRLSQALRDDHPVELHKEHVTALQRFLDSDIVLQAGIHIRPASPETHMAVLEVLLALLERALPSQLHGARKSIICYAWGCLRDFKERDSEVRLQVARAAAFRVVCQFIVAFDTPAKIVLQVYVALLRWTSNEARVSEACLAALDVLAPVLPIRLPRADHHRYPSWFKWLRKILEDEGGSRRINPSAAPSGELVQLLESPAEGAARRRVLLRCWAHLTRHMDLYCEQIRHAAWLSAPAFSTAPEARLLAQFLGCPYWASADGPTVRQLWTLGAPYAVYSPSPRGGGEILPSGPSVGRTPSCVRRLIARHVLWPALRAHVRVVRPAALHWLDTAMRAACALGGTARKRDRDAFEADFADADGNKVVSKAHASASCRRPPAENERAPPSPTPLRAFESAASAPMAHEICAGLEQSISRAHSDASSFSISRAPSDAPRISRCRASSSSSTLSRMDTDHEGISRGPSDVPTISRQRASSTSSTLPGRPPSGISSLASGSSITEGSDTPAQPDWWR